MTEIEPRRSPPGMVPESVQGDRRVALVDILDRVLAGGVVISGDVRLSIADVDMVHISLRTLITSIGALQQSERNPGGRVMP